MKISIITATYNSAKTIRDTIESVNNQDYPNIEHIIVDGSSQDDTLSIVRKYGKKVSIIISEPDKGIYDAMNKGIKVASGDVIGILNSDDFFTSNDVLSTVADAFSLNRIDAVYGDVHFVHPENLKRTVRYYSSSVFRPSLFRYGFMPAHPSFYMKKSCYDKYGLYSIDYKISSDFDLLIRYLYRHKIDYKYVKKDFVTMRTGGISTRNVWSKILLNKEAIQACKNNGIKTNLFLFSLRYIIKMFEFRL